MPSSNCGLKSNPHNAINSILRVTRNSQFAFTDTRLISSPSSHSHIIMIYEYGSAALVFDHACQIALSSISTVYRVCVCGGVYQIVNHTNHRQSSHCLGDDKDDDDDDAPWRRIKTSNNTYQTMPEVIYSTHIYLSSVPSQSALPWGHLSIFRWIQHTNSTVAPLLHCNIYDHGTDGWGIRRDIWLGCLLYIVPNLCAFGAGNRQTVWSWWLRELSDAEELLRQL